MKTQHEPLLDIKNLRVRFHTDTGLVKAVEGLNPQACSDAPRWRINDAGALTLEHTVPAAVVEGLRALGHDPQVAAPGSLEFGSAQIIRRLEATPGTGFAYAAGSDHRRDGQAVGC